MTSKRQFTLKINLGLLVVASSLACLLLPILGVHGYFAEFNLPYSADEHFRLLAGQVVGPGFTLLVTGSLFVLVILRRRVAWWMWLTVLIGPIYTAHAVGGLSHDFSHTVFNRCGSIYGNCIVVFCILSGASLILLAILTRCHGFFRGRKSTF